MSRIKGFLAVLLAVCLLLPSGALAAEEALTVRITLSEGEGYRCEDGTAEVQSGGDVVFLLELDEGRTVTGCSYEDWETEEDGGLCRLTLKKVRYPAFVTLTVGEAAGKICYKTNGGALVDGSGADSVTLKASSAHPRANTEQGTGLMERDGYTLLCWNTEADGTGESVGLGSRITVKEGETVTLYAIWAEWLSAEWFTWEDLGDGTAALTGYSGPKDADPFVIPGEVDGLTVTEIRKGFAKALTGKTVVLPYRLKTVEVSAFRSCGFETLYFFDDIEFITDSSFLETVFRTIHINAALAPCFQKDNEIAYFSDAMDRLILAAEQKKMVFFGGCSMTYGLDSSLVAEAYPDYQVLDLGLIGGTNAAFQFDCIASYMNEGDVLIHAPEVASEYQLMASLEAEPRMYAIVEGNYDLLALADMSRIEMPLQNFQSYNTGRRNMEPGSYQDVIEVYNEYGDICKERPFGTDVSLSDYQYTYVLDYVTEESAANLAEYYGKIREKGASVLVSFAPVNRDGLTDEAIVQKVWKQFEERLKTFLEPYGYPLISSAETYLLRGRYFYDTDYHLNTEGAALRTRLLLQDLTSYKELFLNESGERVSL